MSNVVPIQKSAAGYKLPDHVMYDIRMRMYNWHSADLAKAVGVSVGCINAIRSNRTRWPRGTTLFALLSVLGIDLILVDSKTGARL